MKVLFVRYTAIGDVLMSLPIIQEYARNHPSDIIHVYTLLPWLFYKNDLVHKTIDARCVPFRRIEKNYEQIYYLTYEHHPALHIIDGYSLSSGIRPRNKKINFKIKIDKAQAKNAEDILRDYQDKILIGLQPISAHKIRNYPLCKFKNVINKIKSKDPRFEFIVFAGKRLDIENCINLTGRTINVFLPLALVARCKYFISIDSAFFHYAQALDIPVLGIFGCTRPELRVTNPELVRTVTKKDLDCLGCYHEMEPGSEILLECRRGDLSCMNDLSEDVIVDEFFKLARKERDEQLLIDKEIYEKFSNDFMSKADLIEERERCASFYRERVLEQSKHAVRDCILSVMRNLISTVIAKHYCLRHNLKIWLGIIPK